MMAGPLPGGFFHWLGGLASASFPVPLRSVFSWIIALSLSMDASAAAPQADAARARKWVAAWYSPPLPPIAVLACNDVRAFGHQTVRQVVRLEAGGERLRVRLTNELGLVPMKIGSVHLALSSPNGVTEPQTDHALTFGGRADTIIPVGQAVVSDPVEMKVDAFVNLGISVYYLDRVAPAGHLSQVRISAKGDHGAESLWPGGMLARAPALASGVDVETTTPHRVLVAFGDSITEGAGATPGINMDYPEQLALRLGTRAGNGWVVINSGIGGNRLLYDGMGPRALDRFERDVLDIPGVSAILVMEGINDIGVAFDPEGDSGPLSAGDLISAYQQMIERAHARGLAIFGGTITPYEGAGYFRPEGELVREAVNAWIRTSHAFDGVVDFDQAVRDPQHPARYRGAYQSGDSLHPNDAGYRAMSEAVDPRLFR